MSKILEASSDLSLGAADSRFIDPGSISSALTLRDFRLKNRNDSIYWCISNYIIFAYDICGN